MSTILLLLSLNNLVPQKSLRIRSISNASVLAEVCDMILTVGAKCENIPWCHWGTEFAKNICIRIITKWSLSIEEAAFSLAYVITVLKNFGIFKSLSRATYTPQNVYSIHVDEKVTSDFTDSVRKCLLCFSNIFLASKKESVVYAGFSQAWADLNCMEDLVSSKFPWK